MATPRKYNAYLERAAKRRAAIYAHVQASGSLSDTAREFGISRQRVDQIVKKVEGKAAKG